MKVLVIGGSGFLGSNLVPNIEANNDVTVMEILPYEQAKHLHGLNIKYIWKSMLDINPSDLKGYDEIAFLAAVSDVPLSITSPQWTLYQNVEGITRFLEALKELEDKPRTLFMSTESVYGKSKKFPITEETPMHPTNPYGVSKAAAEMLCREYSEAYKLPVVIFRSTSMFGEYSRAKQVIPIFINQAIHDRDITIEGNGHQSRDFNYVLNMTGAVNLLFKSDIDTGIYNIGSGEEIDLNTLAKTIIDMTNSKSKIVYKPWRLGERGTRLQVSIKKAKRILKYKPVYDFEEGLERTIQYFKSVSSDYYAL